MTTYTYKNWPPTCMSVVLRMYIPVRMSGAHANTFPITVSGLPYIPVGGTTNRRIAVKRRIPGIPRSWVTVTVIGHADSERASSHYCTTLNFKLLICFWKFSCFATLESINIDIVSLLSLLLTWIRLMLQKLAIESSSPYWVQKI